MRLASRKSAIATGTRNTSCTSPKRRSRPRAQRLTPSLFCFQTTRAFGPLRIRLTGSIWHTSSNEPAILFREQDRVISLAWSPQGRFIASTSYNESLCIFDTKDRTLRHRLDASYGSGLAWSPDGKLVVAAIRSDIGVWSAESGQLVRVLEGHMSRPRALAFSSDGALLSSKGGTRRATPVESGKARDRYVSDKKVLIWRTDTWNVCGSLSGLPGNYLHCGLAFSPTSSLLATTTLGDKALQVWSFDENRLLKEAGQAWANICRRCAAGPRDFS